MMEKITLNREELEGKAKELGIKFNATISDENLQKKIDAVLNKENNENREELEGKILITSICAGYRKEVESYEEASQETGLSINAIKEAIESRDLISGYRFNIVK